jgi:hypothetical protein
MDGVIEGLRPRLNGVRQDRHDQSASKPTPLHVSLGMPCGGGMTAVFVSSVTGGGGNHRDHGLDHDLDHNLVGQVLRNIDNVL